MATMGDAIRSLRWPTLAVRLLLALVVATLVGAPGAMADDDPWRSLRGGGHAILMRHAIAPGTGDPAGFVLGDCATQRTLSDKGRRQARRIGEALAAHRVPVDRVLSSRWCRALESAALLDAGPVEPFASLDSFFATPADGPARTAAVAAVIRDLGAGTVVMVTHQVNITALTGVHPTSGEMVVVRPARGPAGGVTVVARIAP